MVQSVAQGPSWGRRVDFGVLSFQEVICYFEESVEWEKKKRLWERGGNQGNIHIKQVSEGKKRMGRGCQRDRRKMRRVWIMNTKERKK